METYLKTYVKHTTIECDCMKNYQTNLRSTHVLTVLTVY